MGIVLLHQVNQLGTDVTNGRTLVGHLAHSHIAGHRDILVLILQDMVVAIQLTRNAGQVWDYRGELAQIKAVHTQGDILQHGRILVLGIEFDTRLIVGNQVHLCLQALVATHKQEVVLVQVKLLITNGWALGQQLKADTIALHLGSHA